jgi:tryptophan synthase alpha chain
MGLFKQDDRFKRSDVVNIAAGQARGAASLDAAFKAGKAEGRALLMPFLVCGYPSADGFLACAEAAGNAGADVLEIGIPFSDPIMDGPVIAAAANEVLSRGFSVDEAFGLLSRAATVFGRPVVAMTYYNLLLHRGLGDFAAAAAGAGVSGAIIPDLSVEESAPWSIAAEQAGLATIFMAAPTSTEERLRAIGMASEGFVYAASTLGVTGVREQMSVRARDLVSSIREATSKPVAVGIGVSTPDHAREVAAYADGVIVGTALVRAIGEGPDPAAATTSLVAALRAAVTPGS